MISNDSPLWWGYIHESGSIQVKRFFSGADVSDAYHSPFVTLVIPPFNASSRESALEIVKSRVGIS